MQLLTTLAAIGITSLAVAFPAQTIIEEVSVTPACMPVIEISIPERPEPVVELRAWENPELPEGYVPYTARYTEEEVEIVAKILYRECRGIPSDTEKACVVWTMCNRVDAGYADTIKAVATAELQYAWYPDTPVWDELYDLAKDVLNRWSRESAGFTGSGRVLPKDYLWFSGDGDHNHFRNKYRGGTRWDYSLESPYES